MKNIVFTLIIGCLVLAVSGCNSTTTNTNTVSSDATVRSLTFTNNSDYPGLKAAVFTIEDRLAADTGRIYNIDSITYGTPIDSVIPVFTFNATPAAAVIYTPYDTIILSRADTVNFTHRPCYLQVQATDLKTIKWYSIDVRVHQIDPDLFVWSKTADHIYPAAATEQKLFCLNDQLVLLVNNGFQNDCYVSSDAKNWAMANSVAVLPANASPRRMVQMQDAIYYGQGATLYHTTNGANWTTTDFSADGIEFENLLFAFNDSLWAIVKQNDTLRLATIATDAQPFNIQLSTFNIPSDFPIADYAALTFRSATNRERAMVVGGYAADGTCLNTRWNLEYSPIDGYHWKNFSIEQPNFASLTGTAIVWYNNRFYMFGGVDADNTIGEANMLESLDEGLHWSVQDTAHNQLPATFTGRQKMSAIVGSDNAIYLVGGQSRTEVFADAYRGKLNSIDW